MNDDARPANPRHNSSKRVNHNHLERSRRCKLKTSFDNLRKALPVFDIGKGRKPSRASRIEVLKEFHEFAERNSKNQVYSMDIKQMREEIVRIRNKIELVSDATKSGNFEAASACVDSYLLQKEKEELHEQREAQKLQDKIPLGNTYENDEDDGSDGWDTETDTDYSEDSDEVSSG